MVATGRGVTALPRWLVAEYGERLALSALRLGKHGVPKQIHLGVRAGDRAIDYIHGFIKQALGMGQAAPEQAAARSGV